MSVKIIYYPDSPVEPETSVISEHTNLAEWVLTGEYNRDKLYVWRDQISDKTYITDFTDEILLEDNVTFHVSAMPMGDPISIIVAVVASVLVGVAAALLIPMPAIPTMANNNKSSSNALQARKNQPRLNERLPDIFGTEVKAFPDLWMSYIQFENNKEFEVSYMCVSRGNVEPDPTTIRDGDTLGADINGFSAAFYRPYQSPNKPSSVPFLQIGDPIPDKLVSARQSNEVDGITLLPPNYETFNKGVQIFTNGNIKVDRGSLELDKLFQTGETVILTDFYVFELVTGETDIYHRHDISGNYTVTAVTVDTVTVDITSQPNWQFAPNGPIVTVAWKRIFSNDWALTDKGIDWTRESWTSEIKPDEEFTAGYFDCSDAQQVWLNFVAQNGIYKKKERIEEWEVDLAVTFRDKDTGTVTAPIAVKMKTNGEDAVQLTEKLDVPFENCEIAVRRTSDTDFEFEGSVVDETKWRDLYLVNAITAEEFGNVTTVLVKTRATDSALRVKDRKLSMAATRYITRHDGTVVASDEFADVIYALHTDPYIGRRTADTLDVDGLYALQEQIVSYFGRGRDPIRVGYTFDDDTYRYEDHLLLICAAVNVTVYQVGSKLKFHFEGPQEFSTQQFGHRSKVPKSQGGEERRNRSLYPREDYDGVELTYKDQETGDFETIYIPADQSATNPETFEFKGCFLRDNALCKANRLRQTQLYQRFTHEFTALDKGRLLAKGQRIDVIDNTRSQTNDGYVEDVDGLTYWLSQPFDITSGAQTSIVLTNRDASLSQGIPVTPHPEYDQAVVLAFPPVEPPYTGHLADPTEYSLATDDLRTSLAMLVTKIEPSSIDKVSISCINYDERYYTYDK